MQCYSVPLIEGDVIIAATDGVWDNLFDTECAALVGHTKAKGNNPGQTAEALARCANMRCSATCTPDPVCTGMGCPGAPSGFVGYHRQRGVVDECWLSSCEGSVLAACSLTSA